VSTPGFLLSRFLGSPSSSSNESFFRWKSDRVTSPTVCRFRRSSIFSTTPMKRSAVWSFCESWRQHIRAVWTYSQYSIFLPLVFSLLALRVSLRQDQVEDALLLVPAAWLGRSVCRVHREVRSLLRSLLFKRALRDAVSVLSDSVSQPWTRYHNRRRG
jgi:hypothetical protein